MAAQATPSDGSPPAHRRSAAERRRESHNRQPHRSEPRGTAANPPIHGAHPGVRIRLMRHGVLVGLGFLCLLAACSPSPRPDSQEAIVQAISEIEAAWVKDIATRDVEKWVSYYAEDGTILLPNAPPVTGRDNIRASLKSRVSDPNFSLTFRPSKIEGSGNIAYVQGAYAATRTDPRTMEAVSDQGKYVTVYRKEADGRWKAVQDMVSSDLPRRVYTR